MLLDSFATFYSPELANMFISIAILTFCLSTQIGFFVYFKTALVSLFGENMFRYVKWVYFLPGSYYFGVMLGYGFIAPWLFFGSYLFFFALAMVWKIQKGGWKQINI